MSASFVLTHLGPKPFPEYGYDCVDQIRLFNTEEPIYVVAGRACERIDTARLAAQKCRLVRKEDLAPTFKHRFYASTELLRFKGLGGFWLFATERFFIIEELMRRYRLRDVFHLENDVLLYFEIAKALEVFRRHYPSMALVRDHDERCVGSLVYARDFYAISRLNTYVSYNLLTRRKNDMGLLSEYSKGKKDMQLPLAAPSYIERFGLRNLRGESPRDTSAYSHNYEEFGMQFDAACFGQFVGGIDRIHSEADTRGFVNETAYANPSKGEVIWRKDDKGRARPYFRYEGNEAAIANLHIHSKDLARYRSDRIE